MAATEPRATVVMIEQVAGVFYVALVVARLIGLSARRRATGRD